MEDDAGRIVELELSINKSEHKIVVIERALEDVMYNIKILFRLIVCLGILVAVLGFSDWLS